MSKGNSTTRTITPTNQLVSIGDPLRRAFLKQQDLGFGDTIDQVHDQTLDK